MTTRSLTQLRRAARTTTARAKAHSKTAASRCRPPATTPLTAQRPRRLGRPRGPERVPLSVRILVETDARLTLACEQTGKTPQYLVEDALQLLYLRLGVPRTTSPQTSEAS